MRSILAVWCLPLLTLLHIYEAAGVRSRHVKPGVHGAHGSHDNFDGGKQFHGETELEHLKSTGFILGDDSRYSFSGQKTKSDDQHGYDSKRNAATKFMSPKESIVSRIIASLDRQGAEVAHFFVHLRQHFRKMLGGGRHHHHYHS